MGTRSLGYVDLPAAVAGLFGAAAIVALTPRIRGRLPWLLWGSLAGAAASGAAVWLAYGALRREVAVDQWGIRLTDRAGDKIDLGIPTAVRQGRHHMTPGVGTMRIPRWWVAVETDAGRTFVFESAAGLMGSGYMEWPEEAPPDTADRFGSPGFDLAAFRAALWASMLR
jgi:hypothetical protein